MKIKSKSLIKFIIFFLLFNSLSFIPQASQVNIDNDNNLNEEFQPILEEIFKCRNRAILNKDLDSLKNLYDLDIKVSLWAYESECKKVNYLENWADKQSVTFTGINSNMKIRKVSKKSKDLYGIAVNVSTDFSYAYTDSPTVNNTFYLGTNHYLNLQKEDDKYIITKEWYTDPFADSLDITNFKSDDMKDFILSRNTPDIKIDDRTQAAIDYAHKYCGVSTDDEYLFKYNSDYTNFNPAGGDCANFASQILYEGGKFKMNGIWKYSGCEGSKAWVNAQAFKNYIVNSGRAGYICKGKYQEVFKPSFNMKPGDFVAYEKNGRIVHISTVTGVDSKGYPLVTCHNTDRLLVPYDLGWSNSNIKFHLIDVYY